MKWTTILMTASVAVLGLGGCASTSTPPQGASRTETQVDYAMTQAVDRQARLNGVLVIWVNRPEKVVTTSD